MSLITVIAAGLSLLFQQPGEPRPIGGSGTNNQRSVAQPPDSFERRRRGETLPQLLEACWRAEEPGNNRNTDLDQFKGVFHSEVLTRWCRATLDARGPVQGKGRNSALSRIDELTLRFVSKDRRIEIHERAGAPVEVKINSQRSSAPWWTGEYREGVLKLARLAHR
jgi:hypothetical protein